MIKIIEKAMKVKKYDEEENNQLKVLKFKRELEISRKYTKIWLNNHHKMKTYKIK